MEEMDKDKSQDMTSNSSEDSREKEDISKNVETKSEEENNKSNSETTSDEESSDPQNTGEINKTEKPKTPASIRIKVVGAIVIVLSSLLVYGIFAGTETKKVEPVKLENNDVNLSEEKAQTSDEMNFPSTYKPKPKVENKEEFNFENTSNYGVQHTPINIEKDFGRKINPLIQEYYATVYNDELNARKSEISFPSTNKKIPSTSLNSSQETTPYIPSQTNPFAEPDINRQADKKQFLRGEENQKIYNSGRELYAVSPYEVKAGTYIPGVLISGINSDLPGNMKAQVREDVYDTVTGNHLLVPKGTTLIGTYDSGVTFGQTRALVVWQRLIFPNGKTVLLDNMAGVDLSGYAGFKDKVNNHNLELFKAVVLSSILGAGTAIVSDDDDDDDSNNWKAEAGRGAGEQVIMIGNRLADKLLSLQPTITIRPGYRFNIMLHSDLVLTPYER